MGGQIISHCRADEQVWHTYSLWIYPFRAPSQKRLFKLEIYYNQWSIWSDSQTANQQTKATKKNTIKYKQVLNIWIRITENSYLLKYVYIQTPVVHSFIHYSRTYKASQWRSFIHSVCHSLIFHMFTMWQSVNLWPPTICFCLHKLGQRLHGTE